MHTCPIFFRFDAAGRSTDPQRAIAEAMADRNVLAHAEHHDRGAGRRLGYYLIAAEPSGAAPRPGPRPGPAAAPSSASAGRTEVTFAVDRSGHTGWVRIRCSGDAPITRTPRIAARLARAVGGYDGAAALTCGAQITQPPGVEALIAGLRDPRRRRPVLIVGAAHDFKVRALADLVGAIVEDSDGLLITHVLDGPATAAFGTAMGPDAAVAPGTGRIFPPAGDDGRLLHTAVGTDRLLGDEYALRRELWHLAARCARAIETPPLAVQAEEMLRARAGGEHADGHRTDTAPPGAPSPPADTVPAAAQPAADDSAGPSPADLPREAPAALPGHQIGPMLRDILAEVRGDRTLTPEALADLRIIARRGLRRTREHRRDRARLARLAEELDDALHTIAELRDRMDRMDEIDAPGIVTDAPPAAGEPATFAALLECIDEMPGVRFTGDAGCTLGLDKQAQSTKYVRKAWRALGALSDYAACRMTPDGPTGLRDYLTHTPAGLRSVSLHNYSAVESDTTGKDPSFREPRTLPVPASVHPDGAVFMAAHFRLGGGNISPRMHFYDDTAGSGLVYVGYIGGHLPNLSTN